jgi:hypothetical protein
MLSCMVLQLLLLKMPVPPLTDAERYGAAADVAEDAGAALLLMLTCMVLQLLLLLKMPVPCLPKLSSIVLQLLLLMMQVPRLLMLSCICFC